MKVGALKIYTAYLNLNRTFFCLYGRKEINYTESNTFVYEC